MVVNPQFTLKAAAVTAIQALGSTMYFQAKTCGINAATLDDALAGNPFILRVQQRLMLLCQLLSLTYANSFADA